VTGSIYTVVVISLERERALTNTVITDRSAILSAARVTYYKSEIILSTQQTTIANSPIIYLIAMRTCANGTNQLLWGRFKIRATLFNFSDRIEACTVGRITVLYKRSKVNLVTFSYSKHISGSIETDPWSNIVEQLLSKVPCILNVPYPGYLLFIPSKAGNLHLGSVHLSAECGYKPAKVLRIWGEHIWGVSHYTVSQNTLTTWHG
jgi:hypothetical protein